jgi:SulP family sulfate permease
LSDYCFFNILGIIYLVPQIEQLPIAALVGVMIMVAIGTFEGKFRIINKMLA